MTSERTTYPPLILAHAVVLVLGALAVALGLISAEPVWFLVAGPCFVFTALLIAIGSHVTFSGPAGRVLRTLLGPARVARVNLRALVWLLAGILATAWGIEGIRQRREPEPPAPEPRIAALAVGALDAASARR